MKNYSMAKARNDAGLSIMQLGSLANVDGKRISEWENGVRDPRIRAVVRVCDVLKISIDEYIGRKVPE